MKTNKRKYELTNNQKNVEGRDVRQIRALIDFRSVKAGQLGGWIETKDNLSQDGDCWVADEAVVMDYGRVSDNAFVGGNARVFAHAFVGENAYVTDNACIDGRARVIGNTFVFENAIISQSAVIRDSANVHGEVHVSGEAKVGNEAWIGGDAYIDGRADIGGDAMIRRNNDFFTFRDPTLMLGWCTYTRSNRMWKSGDFYSTSDELIERGYSCSAECGRFYEAIVRAVWKFMAVQIPKIRRGKE